MLKGSTLQIGVMASSSPAAAATFPDSGDEDAGAGVVIGFPCRFLDVCEKRKQEKPSSAEGEEDAQPQSRRRTKNR